MGELKLFDSVEKKGPSEGVWTVSGVTARARDLIELGFSPLWVKGEVSGFKSYRSGHWYFTLRDKSSQIRCVMFRSDNQYVAVKPEDGIEIFLHGKPSVWDERGEFRLTAKQILATDRGGWWQIELEKAKAALQRDGLLDPARKQPIPDFAARIAVVTSIDGAALRDIASVVGRRWPLAELLVVPTRVQGDGADIEICAALELSGKIPDVDLVIVGRGGGSREDLWAFNSEAVARAVAAVEVPIISAVGHETDVSLTDLVADLASPTPSTAGEAAVPDRESTEQMLRGLARRLGASLSGKTLLGAEKLERTGDRLTHSMVAILDASGADLDELAASLEALSPLRVLQRGFSVVRDKQGKVLARVSDFQTGAEVNVTVSDGTVPVRVVAAKDE